MQKDSYNRFINDKGFKYFLYICEFYSTDKWTVIMWGAFSENVTCMSMVLSYLPAKDIAHYRCQCLEAVRDTQKCKGNWLKYVQTQYPIKKCGRCPAICSVRQVDFCTLCERFVCEDHLEPCFICLRVFCSSCRGSCC